MSLTLKYRPMNFDEVVNQSHIVDILKAQIKASQANNNYLFFWPRWTWKTSIARILSRAVNCPNQTDGNPCNECPACKAMLKWQTLDFVEIDAASHTQVDNIREEIIDKASYPPTALKKKVYIIDEVHMLSKSAFNALLKIMEEPPSYLMFVLATTEINKVPETIISRCQVFNFKKLSNTDIIDRLKFIAEEEGIKYTENGLKLIANVCDGAMRDANKYLDQISILWEINEETVSKFLGVAPDKMIKDFIDFYKSGEVNNVFDKLDEINKSWVDLTNFAKEILLFIDKNFVSDIEFFVRLSDVFKNIIMWIKNYPLPLIIYKSEIYKDLSWKNFLTKSEAQKPIPKIEKKMEVIPQVTQVVEKPKVENNLATDVEDQVAPKETLQTNLSNLDEIMSSAIELCDKPMLKTALKNFVNLDSIDQKTVKLIVINKMQYELLKKSENNIYLWELFSKVLNFEVILELEYMSKEDYLNSKL